MDSENVSREIKYHYDMLTDDVSNIVRKLNTYFGYFAFRYSSKLKTQEIMYDTSDGLLSSIGIILSKQFVKNDIGLYVRKITKLPTEMKRPSKRVKIADCGIKESPKAFATQVAKVINDSFPNVFTIDMADVVGKTFPKINVEIEGQYYEISGGTGFKGSIIFEDAIYTDIPTRRKIRRKSVTLNLPSDPQYEKDNELLLEGIERTCKELIPYKETRFEIAERVFNARNNKNVVQEEHKKVYVEDLKRDEEGNVIEELPNKKKKVRSSKKGAFIAGIILLSICCVLFGYITYYDVSAFSAATTGDPESIINLILMLLSGTMLILTIPAFICGLASLICFAVSCASGVKKIKIWSIILLLLSIILPVLGFFLPFIIINLNYGV